MYFAFLEGAKISIQPPCYKSHFDLFLIASEKVMKSNFNLATKILQMIKKAELTGALKMAVSLLSFRI